MLDLPQGITACLFDLDGVLTQTAKVHAKAWKEMFDEYLRCRSERSGEPLREFAMEDHEEYVDGKPRREGVRSFLGSRGIDLPLGAPDDPPDAGTIYGLGTRKNELVLELIHKDGVEPYAGSVRFAERAREQGLPGARVLGVEPAQAAVFEDALAGVEAGRAGSFGWVVGLDRTGHAQALREHGADVVVQDLAELLDRQRPRS